jgi:hypothetical protein
LEGRVGEVGVEAGEGLAPPARADVALLEVASHMDDTAETVKAPEAAPTMGMVMVRDWPPASVRLIERKPADVATMPTLSLVLDDDSGHLRRMVPELGTLATEQ